MTSPDSGGRARFAGATPSPDQVASTLWESVLAQFMVEGTSSSTPAGLVAITSPNFRDGFAYFSALASPEAQGSGLVAEAALLGFNYAFANWPFRKLYMEATDGSYQAFKSGLERFFLEEGRLRQHVFWNQAYEDLVILAVYRETWARDAPRYLRHLGAGGGDDRPSPTGPSPPGGRATSPRSPASGLTLPSSAQ